MKLKTAVASRRLAPLFAAMLMLALVAAPADAAKKKKKSLKVSVGQFQYPECTVGPDRVRLAIGFEAKVKSKNVTPPKITASYKLTDPATGAVVIAEKVTLTSKLEYFGLGTFMGFTVGTSLTLDGSISYKNTATGKRVTSTASYPTVIPTNDELVAGGIKSCV
ncbi:MAG: hypothetical protein WAP35_06150 [Solirubrobacterales bacterium]